MKDILSRVLGISVNLSCSHLYERGERKEIDTAFDEFIAEASNILHEEDDSPPDVLSPEYEEPDENTEKIHALLEQRRSDIFRENWSTILPENSRALLRRIHDVVLGGDATHVILGEDQHVFSRRFVDKHGSSFMEILDYLEENKLITTLQHTQAFEYLDELFSGLGEF